MKRGIILFLIVLLIPSVLATITIDRPDKILYNKGDAIIIAGNILEETAVQGSLLLTLECDNNSYPSLSTPISLVAGERKRFPEDITVPKITISNLAAGTCHVKAAIISGGNVIEESVSDSFDITTALTGNFNVGETQIQIGNTLSLTGNIFKANGGSTSGSAEIYFKNNEGTSFLVDIINFKDSSFVFNYISMPSTPGTYTIGIIANDIYGNSQVFENIAEFNLVDELYVFAKADTENIIPGGIANIFGEIKTVLLEPVKSGNLKILFDGKKYNSEFKDGKFSYGLKIPEETKTGTQTIGIEAHDNSGNKGVIEINLNVIAVPTSLSIDLDKETIAPGELLTANLLLFDQAGDLIKEEGNIDITNPDGKKIISELLNTDSAYELSLPAFSIPGLWSITGYASGLSAKKEINVKEIVNAEVSLDNQTVHFVNTGNVKYNKPVKLDFNNGQYTIVKRPSLMPNEVTSFIISKDVPSGRYDLRVEYGSEVKEFKDVIIEGKNMMSINWAYSLLLVAAAAMLVYMVKMKKKMYKSNYHQRNRDMALGKSRRKYLKENKITKPPSILQQKESIKEFRERILKDIKETESKNKNEPENKGSGGLFNMFK